jgi:acetyl/propionyl-CoA carboxylase alpha subunit
MKLTFDTQTLELTPSGSGKSYRVEIGGTLRRAQGKPVDVEIIHADAERGKIDLLINGQNVTAYVSSDGMKRWVTVNGQTFMLTKSSDVKRRGAGHDHASELGAPMPGQVRGVNVNEGETVTKGQTLLVLEAMKMEIRIQAQKDGVVKKLWVKQGQTVEREQILIEIEDN